MKRKILTALAVVLVVGAGVTMVIKKQREIAALSSPRQTLPMVQVAIAAHGTLEVRAHYLGTIEPYTQAELSARISGNLLSLTKREGDAVQAGEVVAVIDDQELAARALAANAEVLATRQRLAGAQSAYETQRAICARDETLFAHGAISREALERSRAALDGVKATVGAYEEGLKGLAMNAKATQTQAGYARIAAPFAGVVTRRWMEPGDLATPGKPILSVEKQSPYKVTVQVPQEEMDGVRVGSTAHLSYQERAMAATISRIYPALGKNLLGSVEMVMPASPFGLPSGSTVAIDLVRKVVTGTVVPENALIESTAGSFVCVIQDGVVQVRKVTVLGTAGGKAVIEGELTAGEQVARGQENRLLTLVDGSPVQVEGGAE